MEPYHALTEAQAACQHEHAHQFSNVYALTDWRRKDDGTWEPDLDEGSTIGISKILLEDTDHWRCADCDATLYDLNSVTGGAAGVRLIDNEQREGD